MLGGVGGATNTTVLTTTTIPTGNVAAGKTLFASTCAGCHTLAAAKATGTVGPNLDTLLLPRSTIEKAITDGGATVMTKAQVAKYAARMPAYKSALSTSQIEDLTAFLSTAMTAERTINVSVTDQRVALSRSTIEIGTVSFEVHNKTKTAYRFSIAGKSTPKVAPGATTTLILGLVNAERYSYELTPASQGAKTLKGTLTVTAAKTSTTTVSTPGTTTPATTTTPVTTSPGTTTQTGPPYNESDAACPPGETIQTSGMSDADGDELGQEPNDQDGCL